MLNNINVGSVEAPYQEFKVTLPAGGIQRIDYVTDNFFLYEVSANNSLEVNFGGSVNQTFFTLGIGYKLDQPVGYVTLKNKNTLQPLTLKFAMGLGNIADNRLVASGTIYTQPAQFNTFTATTVAISSGKADIPVAEHTIIQNTSSNLMYIGGTGTDGLQLQAGGTFEFNCAAVVTVWGTNGDTIAIGSFN